MTQRNGRRPSLKIPAEAAFDECVSKSQFARILESHPSRITQLIKDGILKPPALTPEGMVVTALAFEQLLAAGSILPRADAAAPRAVAAVASDAPGDAMTYDEARAAHETLKVKLAELDLAERRGELVPKALADHVLFDCTRALRDAWLGWPARHAAVMASRLKVDPALLLAELDRAVRDQLAAVADPKADWRARSAASYEKGAA